ncbi:MAG: IclR family transcriptional regulator [Spirochaetaceae bacterium]
MSINLSTVETAFSIMETIGQRGRVGAAALARDLGLVRANVHRLLFTLEQLGYVEKSESGEYNLTFSLFELGNTVPHSKNLIDTARPSMLRLAQVVGETVNNGVFFENEVLYIDKVDAAAYLRLDREIGSTDPVHCTSLGKVLLAFQGKESREKIISTLPLIKKTENTITDPTRLEEECARVEERGCAFDFQELSFELNCIAAPVFDAHGHIKSAISISGPSDRFTREKVEASRPNLEATAREISRALAECCG